MHTYSKDEFGLWCVYKWSTYEASSVLAGLPRKQFVEMYETREELLSDFPDALENVEFIVPCAP